jgi:hypothetical protein
MQSPSDPLCARVCSFSPLCTSHIAQQQQKGEIKPIRCTVDFSGAGDDDDGGDGRIDQVTNCQITRLFTIAAIFLGTVGIATSAKLHSMFENCTPYQVHPHLLLHPTPPSYSMFENCTPYQVLFLVFVPYQVLRATSPPTASSTPYLLHTL